MKMRRFIRRRLGGFHRGQGGFTLIELLIVIVILGIIAGIVIPATGAFRTSGNVNAANSEKENVKTSAVAYLADNDNWPADTTVAGFSDYYTGTLKARYYFDTVAPGEGLITQVDGIVGGSWSGVVFDISDQKWVKGDNVDPPAGTQDRA